MLDETTTKGRVIAAAMRLAAQKPWNEVSLRDIAEMAGIDLAGLRGVFQSKVAILSAFARAADDAVLTAAPKPRPDQPARDRIFDVLMTRFDLLAPYKPALKSIMASRPADLELLRRLMASQAWMLHAAGVGTDGVLGFARVAGLSSVYARTIDTWLEEDDPSLGRTMAALDHRLKRGEQAMSSLTDVCSSVNWLADRLRGVVNKTKASESDAASPPVAPI